MSAPLPELFPVGSIAQVTQERPYGTPLRAGDLVEVHGHATFDDGDVVHVVPVDADERTRDALETGARMLGLPLGWAVLADALRPVPEDEQGLGSGEIAEVPTVADLFADAGPAPREVAPGTVLQTGDPVAVPDEVFLARLLDPRVVARVVYLGGPAKDGRHALGVAIDCREHGEEWVVLDLLPSSFRPA